MHLVRLPRLLTLALLAALTARAATYDVGPAAGQLPRLSDVPWGGLKPGDTVNINCKPGGYHEIIQISSTGTAAQPIVIRGIPDPVTKALPIIDGEGAVMDPRVDFRNPVFENLGVILVTPRAKGYLYGQTFPAYLAIESLDIRNALYDPTGAPHFTDAHGVARNYHDFACGIYIEFAQHLTIRGCEISFNGNGIFANSKNGAAQASVDLLIEKNFIHDNGQPIIPGVNNGYHDHNVYLEAVGAVYQFNRFGPLRPGCYGTMIKDRSSGTVIRYNEVVSTTCSEIFTIVDPQGGAGYIDQQPDYRDAFVYGNIITLQSTGTNGGTNLVTFAAFNGVSSYPTQHRGTLYFYHNTVVNHRTRVGGFFVTDPTYAGTPNIAEKVDARNNIFYTDTAIQNNLYDAFHFTVVAASTTFNFGMNWVSPGTRADAYGKNSGTTFTGWSNLVVGDYLGKNSANFSSLAALNYHLIGGSDALDAAGPLAPAALAKGYDVAKEYAGPQGFAPRAVIGAAADLGAFESPAAYLPPPGNHAPVALPLAVNLVGPASVAFALPGFDADGDLLTFTVTGQPARGKITGNAPSLAFTPVAGGGSVALSYVVSDGYVVSKTGYVYLAFNDAGNTPPAVALSAPAANSTYAAGSAVAVSANASDADGIARVDFMDGATYLGSAYAAPYTVNWTNVAPGTHQLVARAYDNAGQRAFSQPIVVTVQ